MPEFSFNSNDKLNTCHPLLQKLFREVIKNDDCTIIEGHRGKSRQNELYNQDPPKTEHQWPNSGHNNMPATAVDAGPYIPGKKIPWKEPEQFYFFAGKVLAKARELGIKIRWGGDWDRDNDVKDQKFMDLDHFELLDAGKGDW